MVGRNTGPQSWRIKVETIEKKVVVGSAIQKHGFIFNYNDAGKNVQSSGDDDSFWCLLTHVHNTIALFIE